jgi:uncharacterized membrane protein
MTKMSSSQLWDRLADAGYVTGEMVPLDERQTPWFVRIMLGFAGWIGALFLLGFVAMSMQFAFKSSTAAMIVGSLFCAAAAFIFRAGSRNDFAVQFGLATSFAGQALFIYGIMEMFHGMSGGNYLIIMIFEAVLVAVISNPIHRVACSFGAALSFGLALSSFRLPGIAPALITLGIAVIWLYELKWAKRGSLVRPIGYGLVLAAVFINGALLMHSPMSYGAGSGIDPKLIMYSYWARVVINGAVFIFAVSRLLSREGFGINDRLAQVALIAALAIAISSFKAPGIITGLVVILLGYANGNRVLTGLGILASLAYLSHYYYQLQTTLLVKSVSLAITGAVLLAARFALGLLRTGDERKGGSHA